ncbi:plastocyanin/azurin family copper-binding protein [Hufsiella ginkgonis]|uniref:Auracyanin family protein n=1 Tax=Hufsiella ginkgonis TaxID=2695274 RepID=A0A7K1Y1E4_9SPHI|nr:plastocyanin/azurin family copper-binding protein [Hufsiella ginkgonis]MXV17070.1 auracyanin family protein [Hufsiella ginkgonis]
MNWFGRLAANALTCALCFSYSQASFGQQAPAAILPDKEEDYYRLLTLPIPQGTILEIGGMATLPNGSLMVCTRRGEVWNISNTTGPGMPVYKKFASGMHEALWLAYKNGDVYVTQRSELTRLRDTDGDGRADSYDKVYSWPISGNYHEYAYGPMFMPDGNMRVTLNLSWIGKGASLTKWRGWMLEITPDGKMTPIAAGLRSPAGFMMNAAGDVFYSENQGDWVGSGRITHLEKGDFAGNPASLRWSGEPGSPVKLTPADIPDTGEPMFDVAKRVPGLKPPAIWLPYGIMGKSTSELLNDYTGGKFGPFEGQLFVGDQTQSKIMRVALEKVNGVYQGVLFPFREGFSSGILRMVWGHDGSLFAGMTSRGWSAVGKEEYGLQRLVWTGAMPFEMKTVRAMPDGFEIEFTQPVDRAIAADPASYAITGFTYKYHSTYGSPVINNAACPVLGVVVSQDGMKARIVADSIRMGYIHEIKAEGVRSAKGKPLLHNFGYYTLNSIPAGEKLKITAVRPAIAHHAGMQGMPAKTPAQKPAVAVPSAKRVIAQPVSWGKAEADYTVVIGTKPGLKFDQAVFYVKAGSRVKLVFNNNDDMQHNLVIVQPGTAIEVGELGMKMGLLGEKNNYVPQTPKVLYHTNLLGPGTKETIYFTAPTKSGDYPYECSVPGHFYVMQGIMKVLN